MADERTQQRRALALRTAAPVVLLVLVAYVLLIDAHAKTWQVVLAWIVLVLAILNFALLGLIHVMGKRVRASLPAPEAAPERSDGDVR